MSSNPFSPPAPPGEGITWADLNGRLLLIEPTEYEDHVPTVHTKAGEKSPAVRADVVVLDGDAKGETYTDTLIFPKLLVSQTKPKIGEKVLGRLAQGEAQAGKNAPWLLKPPGDEDVQVGVNYLAYRDKNSLSKPDAPSAGDQWAGKQATEEPVPF